MIKLKVIHQEPNTSQDVILTPEILAGGGGIIGRHPKCDLVLNSPEVSRVHGRLIYKAGQYYFSDLGSTGGSTVNKQEAEVNENFLLQPDDVIEIGGFVLLVTEVELNNFNNNSIVDIVSKWLANFPESMTQFWIVLVCVVALLVVIFRLNFAA